MTARTPHAVARALLAAALGVGALAGCAGSDDAAPTTTAEATSTTIDRSTNEPTTTTVFRSGDDGYAAFRIPAIVRTAEGVLLAFAEGRRGSSADDGDVDLVLKRSADGGATWGPMEVVADDGEDFVGNPSPVIDAATGRVVLLAVHKDGDDDEVEIRTGAGDDTSRLWLFTSDDDGDTWTEPRDLTADVKLPEWAWYSAGPGHAIQLRSGPHEGRLVAPANHSQVPLGQGDHVIYSDDGGDTWEIGAIDTRESGPTSPDESIAAELPDGTIVFSSRNQQTQAPWHRLRTTSTDGGESFVAPYAEQVGLTVPVVQGSILWAGGDDGRLLFSAPASQTDREELRIRSSVDEGETWSEGIVIVPGPAAYSDLVELEAGAVAVLYEAGDDGPNERIDLTVLGLSTIP